MILKMATNRTVSWLRDCVNSWDRFWFTPSQPHVLAILRICTGLMLLYSHLVLATSLTDFLGDNGWINNTTARQLHDGTFGCRRHGTIISLAFQQSTSNLGASFTNHFGDCLIRRGRANTYYGASSVFPAANVSASFDRYTLRTRSNHDLQCHVFDVVTLWEYLQH